MAVCNTQGPGLNSHLGSIVTVINYNQLSAVGPLEKGEGHTELEQKDLEFPLLDGLCPAISGLGLLPHCQFVYACHRILNIPKELVSNIDS